MLLATYNEGGTVFHSTAKFKAVEAFQEIFSLAKENLTREEVKNYY